MVFKLPISSVWRWLPSAKHRDWVIRVGFSLSQAVFLATSRTEPLLGHDVIVMMPPIQEQARSNRRETKT